MKSILLTGANGFIGKYFIKKYEDQYNIQTFSFQNNDFNALDLLTTDIVIHLSALVHQKKIQSREQYECINVSNTLRLAEIAKKYGVKNFIFMSTIAVYGTETGIINEESECNPISDYGISKLKAENKLKELEDENFKISIIRSPIVNGYNGPGNMKSLIALTHKISILPFGKIDNRRSVVYVGNLCHLINEVIQQNRSGLFLASDDVSISTSNLIKLIAISLEKKIYLIRIPLFETLFRLLKPSFYKRLYGSLEIDNTLTKKELNLTNPYSVEDGIKFMIQGE